MKRRVMIVMVWLVMVLAGAAMFTRSATAQTKPANAYWYQFVQNNDLKTYGWVGCSNVEPNQMMSLLTSRNFIRLDDRREAAEGIWSETRNAPSNVFISGLEISFFQVFDDDPLGKPVSDNDAD